MKNINKKIFILAIPVILFVVFARFNFENSFFSNLFLSFDKVVYADDGGEGGEGSEGGEGGEGSEGGEGGEGEGTDSAADSAADSSAGAANSSDAAAGNAAEAAASATDSTNSAANAGATAEAAADAANSAANSCSAEDAAAAAADAATASAAADNAAAAAAAAADVAASEAAAAATAAASAPNDAVAAAAAEAAATSAAVAADAAAAAASAAYSGSVAADAAATAASAASATCSCSHDGSSDANIDDYNNNCVFNYRNSCSTSNSCGQTNLGTINCNGTCSAAMPICPASEILITPTSLSYTASEGSSVFSQDTRNAVIRNNGQTDSVLNWLASTPAPWISFVSNSGSIVAGNNANLGVRVNPSSLGAGNYNGVITVSDPSASNSPQTINVSLIITNPTSAATYSISPSMSLTQSGQSVQFRGFYDMDGPSGPSLQQDMTGPAVWRSSDNSIATINNSGYATCKGNKDGSIMITSVYSKLAATAGLVCYTPLSPTVDLKINGSDFPSAVTAPANLNISWITTNSDEIVNCSGVGFGWNGAKSVSGGNDSGGNLNNVPAGTQTYAIGCETKQGGTISDSVIIAVNTESAYSCGRCSSVYKYTWETFTAASSTCTASTPSIPGSSLSYSKSCSCASGSGTYNPTWNTECETGPIVIIEVPTSTPRPPVCPYETCPQIPLSLQAPDCVFTATPSNLIPPQASTTISWTCQRANTCYLGVSSLPVGYSTPAGFCSAFSGTMEGSYCKVNNTAFTKSVSLTKTTNFTLNCRNDNGNEITTSTAKMADPSLREINPQ